jgi:hypothetical protein
MSKETLIKTAEAINGNRRPRMGLEHDMTFPPLGRISNAKVIKGNDNEYYLIGNQEYYDKRENITLNDGTKMIKESFSSQGTPFAEVDFKYLENIEILADISNFTSDKSFTFYYKELKDESKIKFNGRRLLRKSVFNDPEIVIRLSELYVLYFFGRHLFPKLAKKVGDKLSDKISDDIIKLYDLIKILVMKSTKYLNPKNKKTTYIFDFPAEINIELIIKSNSADEVLESIKKEQLEKLQSKIHEYKKLFSAEKIQFIFSASKEWKLNYLLTKTGEAIGLEKCFKDRDKKFEEVIKETIIRNKK